jgi:hypothetical protein
MNTASRKVMTQFEQDMRLVVAISEVSGVKLKATMVSPDLSAAQIVGTTPATIPIEYAYDKDKGKLTRNGVAILENLTDCQFLFFSSIDAPTTSTASIKKVLVAATMNKSIAGSGGITNSDYLVSAIVTMRCRNNH